MQKVAYVWTNEEKVLLLLARMTLSQDDKKEIAKLMKEEFDGEYFLSLVLRHQLVSVVVYNMEKLRSEGIYINLSIKVKMSFMMYKQKNYNQKKAYLQEIERLGTIFYNQKYKVVLLKGMALNQLVYKEDVRDSTDIDILVAENDIINIFKLLRSMGYTAYVGNKEISETDVEQILQVCSCAVCEFVRRDEAFSYYIDLHVAKRNSPEFLDSSYYHASQTNNGVYIPDLIDTCIFACMHAWRHYPHPYRVQSLENLLKIKDLFDIREIYLKLTQLELLEKLIVRAEQIGAIKVVVEMMYVTERLYGSFLCERLVSEERFVTHDYKDGTFESCLEQRIMRPEKERDMLLKYELEKEKLSFHYTDYIAYKFEKSWYNDYDDKQYWNKAEVYNISRDTYCAPYYGFNISSAHGQSAKMSFGWSEMHFLVRLCVEDEHYCWNQEGYFNELHHRIVLAFEGKLNPLYFVSLQEEGRHNIYKVNYDNRLCQHRVVNNGVILAKRFSNGYECVVGIPWEEIKTKCDIGNCIQIWVNIETGDIKGLGHILLSPQNMSDMVKLCL